MYEKKQLLSPALRVWIEKQIEWLESLAAYIPEAELEVESLKFAYSLDAISELISYANAYWFFDTARIKNKKEKNFFLIEPIRKKGKISLDAYGVRCVCYYKQASNKFEISEKVFSISELKRFTRSNCFDLEDYQEALEAFESLEGRQEGRF